MIHVKTKGETLTADHLNQMYWDLNKFYYGESISTEEIQYEWSRIPHFYYNYYVYQYATDLVPQHCLVKRFIMVGM